MSLEQRLNEVHSNPVSQEQCARYQVLLDEYIGGDSAGCIQKIISSFMTTDTQQFVSKMMMLHVAKSLPRIQEDIIEDVANHILTSIKNHTHAQSFDEADFLVREALFSYYVKFGQYKDASITLGAVNTESTVKPLTNEEKVDIHVRCAEASLEGGETIDAEAFVSRSTALIDGVGAAAWQLLLRHRATHARVLDANRKFVDAAMRYYEISNIQNAEVDAEDLLELMGKAVTCAVLGKAGPQRSRVLGLLFKDERLRTLELLPRYAGHPLVLTRMCRNELLRENELAAFEAALDKHQTVVSGDGLSILQRAVVEHNMLAAGRIYDNIRFEELAHLLRLDARLAEKVAARMIGEDRLKASIDQTEGILQFEDDCDALLGWNDRIGDLCAQLGECVESMHLAYPPMPDPV